MELVDRYSSLAAEQSAIDYAEMASVRRANVAADEMRRLATLLASRGPDAVREFPGLLAARDANVALWAAHHLLELSPLPHDRERALALIQSRSRDDSA